MQHILRRVFVVSVLVGCALGAAACSSSSSSEATPASQSAKLRGRYALTARAGAPYTAIWFSADRYEAVLAECAPSSATCLEDGSYFYDGRTLTLVRGRSVAHVIGFVPSDQATTTTRSLQQRAAASTGDAPASPGAGESDACASDAVASDAPSADGAEGSTVALVAGPVSCLLDGLVVASANVDFGGGTTGQATRLGDERPADPTLVAAKNCPSECLNTTCGCFKNTDECSGLIGGARCIDIQSYCTPC